MVILIPLTNKKTSTEGLFIPYYEWCLIWNMISNHEELMGLNTSGGFTGGKMFGKKYHKILLENSRRIFKGRENPEMKKAILKVNSGFKAYSEQIFSQSRELMDIKAEFSFNTLLILIKFLASCEGFVLL